MSGETQTIRVGRGQGCDIVLSHASVSRRHAELEIQPHGAISIRDLNSTGGTFVLRNKKEMPVLGRTELQKSDGLRLGDYEISVADLLGLAEEAGLLSAAGSGHSVRSGRVSDSVRPAPPVEPEGRPKTRMVRCGCGTIKERDKACPSCGS